MTREELRNVYGERHFKVKNSVNILDIKRAYRKNGGKLKREQFTEVIQEVNSLIQREILNGERFDIPSGIGSIQILKDKTRITEDGKAKYKVDWKSTLDYWLEDSKAREKKKLIKDVSQDWIYKIVYTQGKVCPNISFVTFTPMRAFKLLVKDYIQTGKLKDALLRYETKYNKS